MARYSVTGLSQTAQAAGAPSGTTVNGYLGYLGAGSTAGFRLRRVKVGIRLTSAAVPTSQQVSIGISRQTIAPSGTGLASALAGEPLEFWTPADPTAGLITTTATTLGTGGPTLDANYLDTITINTQSFADVPWEFMEEIVVNKGTANGVAFTILGGTLPANHLVAITPTWEV